MSWNYRVMRLATLDGTPWYQIHSVFYHENGKIKAHSARMVGVGGESLEELRGELETLRLALEKPVLEYSEESGYKEVAE